MSEDKRSYGAQGLGKKQGTEWSPQSGAGCRQRQDRVRLGLSGRTEGVPVADFPPGPQSVGVGRLTGMWRAADTSQIQMHTPCLEGVAPGQPESRLRLQRAGQLQAARSRLQLCRVNTSFNFIHMLVLVPRCLSSVHTNGLQIVLSEDLSKTPPFILSRAVISDSGFWSFLSNRFNANSSLHRAAYVPLAVGDCKAAFMEKQSSLASCPHRGPCQQGILL